MLIKMIEGATRTLGKSQGYLALPVRDEKMKVVFPDGREEVLPAMASAWEPTPEELAQLNAGGSVRLTVVGTAHPPVRVEVQKADPEER